jgi:hypothetical protein
MLSTKHTQNDENKPFSFVDASTLAPKCVQRTAQSFSCTEPDHHRDIIVEFVLKNSTECI